MRAESETTLPIRDLRRQAGKWLKAQREQAGLTQAEVAERVGLRYYTFVSQVEGGHGRVPSEHFHAWACALGLEPRTFARTLLQYYDPDIFHLLFPEEPGVVDPALLRGGRAAPGTA